MKLMDEEGSTDYISGVWNDLMQYGTGGAKGAMISSGFGAAAMFAGDLASGTVGHMLNRAISGKKQNLGESLWGGLTNAVSGLLGGNKAAKGAAQVFKRGFADGAATSAMNYIHDTAGIGDAGSSRDYTPGTSRAIAAGMSSVSWKTKKIKDPRSSCGTKDTFSGGIGSQSTRGYQQRGNRRRSGTKSGFSLGGMLRSAVLGGLVGGLTGTAIHGMGKALDVVAGSIVTKRRSRQQRIGKNETKDSLLKYNLQFFADKDESIVKGRKVPASLLQGEANTRGYLGIKDGKPNYVGITNNIERRQDQHGDRFDYLREITSEPLTRRQARAIEQVMIEENQGFSNKINSVSSKRNWYNDAKVWGTSWLKEHGYIK